MNRKVLAAIIAMLVSLSTIFMAVPANAITNPLPVLSKNSGMSGITVTVTAPANPAVAGFTAKHQVFVLFDQDVSDADLGLPLFPFLTTEMYRPMIKTAGGLVEEDYGYAPGDPIYRSAGAVAPGDMRLTPVTIGAKNYAAGSIVVTGDLDVSGSLNPFAGRVMHTGAATGFNWAAGDGIYIQDFGNQKPGWTQVGPADLRARYPSVTIKLPRVTRSVTYAAWTKVKSPVFDFHKSIYQDSDLTGNVTVGDARINEVTIPQVRYAPGTFVYVEDQDAALLVANFAATDYFADTDISGHWDANEWIYSVVSGLTGKVEIGDTRNSYVTIGASTYLPTTKVAAGDLDIGTAIRVFPTIQKHYGSLGSFTYGDWIYNQTTPGLVVSCAVSSCPPGTTVRASAVDWTDKSMAKTGGTLPVAWPDDWLNVVGYAASTPVTWGNNDLGRALSAFAVTDRHTGGAGAYSAGQSIYRDYDNMIGIGDTRESVIWSGKLRTYSGSWPWPIAAAPFYLPGSNVEAGDFDLSLPNIQLSPFAANERYYDPFGDGSYLGSDLVSTGGANDLGNAAPFAPGTPALGAPPAPISFTVPSNRPAGTHVVMVITDEPPSLVMVGPFLTAGFRALSEFPLGGTLPLDPLPWTGIGPSDTWHWSISDFAYQASPAFFIIPTVCALEMSPGVYAHNLGTPVGIVKSDYVRSSIIQNATGDISLDITLCGEVSSLSIYVPPEFTFLRADTTSVWTSITNDYGRISLGRQGSRDAIAPGWWRIVVENGTISPYRYVIRLFNVKAPTVCGRYFVKVFADGQSIGAENFPTVVVKCDLDPAYISGRVMNGTQGMYAEPVTVSGMVVAQGTTRQGRTVTAQAYFNPSANGAYTIYGLAAGTYTLNASADGFTPLEMSVRVTVSTGQSLEGVDIYLHPSVTISGLITSKCVSGQVSWGIVSNSSLITIELSDYSGGLVASVTGRTDPLLSYYHFMLNGSAELDGHVPQDYADYVSGFAFGDYVVNARVNGYYQKDVIRVHVFDYSREIVVPLDLWGSGSFNVTVHFRYSEGGDLDSVPKDGILRVNVYAPDGTLGGSYSRRIHSSVDDDNSTWSVLVGISGSRGDYGPPTGVYVIQASFPGYVQTTLVQAAIGGGCTVTSLSFDLVRAGSLIIVLRSVNWQTPPLNVTWLYPNAPVRFELIGSTGVVYTANGRQSDSSATTVTVTGLPADRYLLRAYTVGYVQAREYTVVVSLGSVSDMKMDLLTGTRINLILTFRTEGLIASIDTYPYKWDQAPVRIELYDTHGILVAADATRIPANSTVWTAGFRSYAGNPALRWVNFYDTTDRQLHKDYGLPPGTYLVKVWVPGYSQLETLTVTTTPESIITVPLSFEKLSRVFGTISGFNMYGDLIPISWATITAYGPVKAYTSSLDGFYQMWLPNGKYMLAAGSPGYETQGAEIHVSMAWELPADFDLRPPGGTVPELSAAELTLPVVLIVVCLSLCRMRHLGGSSLRRPFIATDERERPTRTQKESFLK